VTRLIQLSTRQAPRSGQVVVIFEEHEDVSFVLDDEWVSVEMSGGSFEEPEVIQASTHPKRADAGSYSHLPSVRAKPL